MRISGLITSGHRRAGYIAESLSADNLLSMETVARGENVLCRIEGEKLRSVIASVDDYLTNLGIAEELVYTGNDMQEDDGTGTSDPENTTEVN